MLPVSGYVRLAALGFSIELFGLVPLPTLWLAPELALWAAAAHNALVFILMGAILTHIGGVLLHSRLTGEGVMHRMGLGPSR